jgi:NADH-quinone oxidoreductase subunit G
VKYVCLMDDANSRGASDMGATPEFAPGYAPASTPGVSLHEMLAAPRLDALWCVGSDPLAGTALAAQDAFLVVQDLFLTSTAERADVVLPSASAYEKNGTYTNTCGEVQRVKAAARVMGVKSDLEIIGLIAREMGLQPAIWSADAVLAEIRASVRGYGVALPIILTGGAAPTMPVNDAGLAPAPEHIAGAVRTRYAGGTALRYSKALNSIMEAPGALYED